MNTISLQFTKKEWKVSLLAALSAFCVYTCMYAFRKPFTSANFQGISFAGVDYKIWLVIAQTIGYTASKFFGIGFIGSMQTDKRAPAILKLIFSPGFPSYSLPYFPHHLTCCFFF